METLKNSLDNSPTRLSTEDALNLIIANQILMMKKLQSIENIITKNENKTQTDDLIRELSLSVTPFNYKIAVQHSLQLVNAYLTGEV